ncbi:PLP-dependent aminotransferase family protein [Actinomadura alba]|uniref:MocR-like pyridoxine biosynthesis transcription factor PdxR n=1 Tax=Actinomadura alba TaxID=406431 RepID=UPI001C9D506B|nr:PLP-dependent aminotransferase family protein [Actinomadura alba]
MGVDLHLELDPAFGRRSGLERALRQAIRTGRLAAQTRLPSTRALAAELNIARGTVSAAYDQLIAEGYLSARTGSGTVVTGRPEIRAPAKRPVSEAPPPRYDLRPGSPDVSAFPTAAWLRATRRALDHAPAAAYDYGDPRGRIELRTALAEYLGRARGVLTTPEQIVITSGYVHALALLADVIGGVAPATIAMEDPGLSFHRDVVRHARARVVALPVDERGARTDLLSTAAFSDVRAVVVTPAHQYPTGVTLHPQRRHAVAEWTGARDGLVIEDDYDGEFRYDRQPVGALQGMAPDHVAYVGTTSKTLGPALRLGWMVLPERLIEPVTEAKRHTVMHTETIGQLTLADLIASHAYERHIRACRLRYRRRRDLLISRLGPRSERRFTVYGIAAGLHVMISLPATGPSEERILTDAADQGLALGDLGSHWHTPGDRPQGLIIGYGTPGEGAYPAALDTMARVLRGL